MRGHKRRAGDVVVEGKGQITRGSVHVLVWVRVGACVSSQKWSIECVYPPQEDRADLHPFTAPVQTSAHEWLHTPLSSGMCTAARPFSRCAEGLILSFMSVSQ